MLRLVTFVVFALLIAVWFGPALHAGGFAFLLPLAALVLLAFVFVAERGRYRGSLPLSESTGWTATGEIFRDPTTGIVNDVFADPASGRRTYRPRQS